MCDVCEKVWNGAPIKRRANMPFRPDLDGTNGRIIYLCTKCSPWVMEFNEGQETLERIKRDWYIPPMARRGYGGDL